MDIFFLFCVLNLGQFVDLVTCALIRQSMQSITGFTRNKKVKANTIFQTSTDNGLYFCRKDCLLISQCNIISYNTRKHECHLGQTDTEVEDIDDAAILTSASKYWDKSLFNLGNCSSPSCGSGTKCITLTKGGNKCIKMLFATTGEESTTSSMTTSAESTTTVALKTTARVTTQEQSTSFMTTSPDSTTQSTTTAELTTTARGCPDSYIKIDNIDLCYKIYQVQKLTTEAREICVQDGGNLIMLNTNSIFNAVHDIVSETTYSSRVTVDGKYNTLSGKVEYWTGAALDTTKISSQAPVPSSTNNCIYINIYYNLFYFRTMPCSSNAYFMCGIPL